MVDEQRLGPYLIDRELGSGGMGRVYAAVVERRVRGLEPGTRVALKVVHPHLLETEGFFKRFLREAEIGQAVAHSNVVRTFDCDAAGGAHFLAMEYVEGQTLRELLVELERVPEELCRHVGIEIAKGLAAIHAAGVIHRDMKPENVLITDDHVVKVMDLGVARLADEAVRLSQTGAFVGSLQYAAPESFRGGGADVDGRVDLHALGVLLYELACGLNPYLAEDVPQTIRKVLHEEPRRLGDVNPQLSAFFEEVVHCLLAKDRDERFASADELATVLSEGEDTAWWHRRASMIRTITKRPLRRVRIPRETAVYGREDELTKLRTLYDAAKSGEGCVVVLAGEAGIGKSRLVDELIGRMQRDGEDINFLFGSYPPGGAATALGGFSTAYREQFGEAGCAEYVPTTPVLVPAFDALLRGESTPKDEEPLTKDSLQTCFVNATRALGAERTTVVLIDDLHFAPDGGRSLFTSLAMAVPGHRVLLIGTTRPGVADDWMAGLTRLDQTQQLTLHRLGPKDLMALLRDTLNSERLATELAAQIATKSDGNPFFVFEIIRGLREGQFITQQDDGTWVSTRVIDAIQIPSSVLDLVNARVADLTEDERNLLDVAACWGFEWDPLLVGAVLEMKQIPLMRTLAHIEKKHRLVRSAGRRFVFDHHQVQEALYAAMPELLREPYHAALAEALETRTTAADQDPESLDGGLCVDLCDHYLKGARGDSALRYLPAAQSHLTNGYLHAEMVALTERALAAPGLLTGAERARTLLRLCDALDPLGRRVRQEECAREAAFLADAAADGELHGRAARALGIVLALVSRRTEAEAAFRHALEIAVARGDRKAEAGAMGSLGTLLKFQGRFPEGKAHVERYLAISREIGHREGEAIAAGNLGIILKAQGRLLDANELYERALALSRELGDRQGEARAMGNLGVVLMGQGRLAEARECSERLRAVSRETGHRLGAALALYNLGRAFGEEGEFARAEEHLLACLAASEETGHRHLTASTHVVLGSLRASLGSAVGDGAGARESLAAARDLAAEIDVAEVETLARCELACLAGGDAADALAAFAEHESRLDAEDRLDARHLLWKATGDRAHLLEAKRLLDDSVAHVDDATRASMLTNLRVNREVLAAWEAKAG